jgi:hypothetical protein
MTLSREDRLYEKFNKAAVRFWNATTAFENGPECLGVRGRMMDAADAMLLARDELKGCAMRPDRWDLVVQDIADMAGYLERAAIRLNPQPVKTSTGRMTYRILNKPRFDA